MNNSYLFPTARRPSHEVLDQDDNIPPPHVSRSASIASAIMSTKMDRPRAHCKKLVLCFDGTGNKFKGDETDSNILKIFRMLDRISGDQFHYYQPGIGTYIVSNDLSHTSTYMHMKSWYMKMKDSAVGTSFDQHVIGGYKFLMRFYAPGDEIYMFGFSRGSYTARFLAEMLDYVGLVTKGNEEMVFFAWKTFSQWQCRQGRTEAEKQKKHDMLEFMKGFRETFARPVRRIRFLGLFDTVNSVPRFETAWMQRSKFPYTAKSSAKVIRHAVSIDERRAKFRQDLISQEGRRVHKTTKAREEHMHEKEEHGLEHQLEQFAHRYSHKKPKTEEEKAAKEERRASRMEKSERPGNTAEKTALHAQRAETDAEKPALDAERAERAAAKAQAREQWQAAHPMLGVPEAPLPHAHEHLLHHQHEHSEHFAERYREPSRSRSRSRGRDASVSWPMDRGASISAGPPPTDAAAAAAATDVDELSQLSLDSGSEGEGEQDIEELWFPGGHGDIGGGWVTREDGKALSHVPLVWMVREAQRAGLTFDRHKMEALDCWHESEFGGDGTVAGAAAGGAAAAAEASLAHVPDIQISASSPQPAPSAAPSPNGQYFAAAAPPRPADTDSGGGAAAADDDEEKKPKRWRMKADKEEEERPVSGFHRKLHHAATGSVLHDCLRYGGGLSFGQTLSWSIMEYIPFRRMDLRPDGSWKPIRWPLPRGEVRDIPGNAKVHNSVIRRMERDPSYRPGNLIVGGGGRGVRRAPASYGMGEWVCVQDRGSMVGEAYVRREMVEEGRVGKE